MTWWWAFYGALFLVGLAGATFGRRDRCESMLGELRCERRPTRGGEDHYPEAHRHGDVQWDVPDEGPLETYPLLRSPVVPVCDKCHGLGTLGSWEAPRCGAVAKSGERCQFPRDHKHGHWWSDGKRSMTWAGGWSFGIGAKT